MLQSKPNRQSNTHRLAVVHQLVLDNPKPEDVPSLPEDSRQMVKHASDVEVANTPLTNVLPMEKLVAAARR